MHKKLVSTKGCQFCSFESESQLQFIVKFVLKVHVPVFSLKSCPLYGSLQEWWGQNECYFKFFFIKRDHVNVVVIK